VEDGHLVAARLQRRLEVDHVPQAALAQRGHAHQRPVGARGLGRAHGAHGGACALGQGGAAQAVETVEPAGPEHHDEIRRDALGRDQVRVGYRGHHHLGHAQRQRGRDVEGEVRPHGAAECQQAVDAAFGVQPCGGQGGALGHGLHGGVLVAAVHHGLQRGAGGLGHLGVGDVHAHVAGGQHTHVHQQHLGAQRLHPLAQEGEFVALGVGGAD